MYEARLELNKNILMFLGCALIAIVISATIIKNPLIAIGVCSLPLVLLFVGRITFFFFFAFVLGPISVGTGLSLFLDYPFAEIDNAIKTFGLLTLSIIFIGIGLIQRKKTIHTTYLTVFFLSTLVWIIPILHTVSFKDSLYFVKMLIPPLVFIIITMYSESINFAVIKKWLIFVVCGNFLLSIIQLATNQGVGDIVRASGLTTARNTLSAYMSFLLIFVIIIDALKKKESPPPQTPVLRSRYINEVKKPISQENFLLIFTITILEFITFGRAGWLAFGLTLFAYLIWTKKTWLMVRIAVLTLPIIYFYKDSIIQRFAYGQGTSEHRDMITAMLLPIAEKHFWTGWGFGATKHFMTLYQSISKGLTIPHNDYVRLLVDMGAINLLLYIIPFVLIMIRMLSIAFKRSVPQGIRLAAFMTYISVLQVALYFSVYNVLDMFYATTLLVWSFAAFVEIEYRKHLKSFIQPMLSRPKQRF